jgi:hypothetical protein
MITILAKCICLDKNFNRAILENGPDVGIGCWFDLKVFNSVMVKRLGKWKIIQVEDRFYKVSTEKKDEIYYLGTGKDKMEQCDKYILMDIGSDDIIKRIYWTDEWALEWLLK